MFRKLILITALSTLLVLTACQAVGVVSTRSIKGSGNIVAEDRGVNGFAGIRIMLGANLELTQGNNESLVVEADENLMPYILTDVQNGTLVVSTPHNTSLSPSSPIQLKVAFQSLTNLEIVGSSDVTAANLDLDTLGISFSGSGSTRLSGSVGTQMITIKGSARLNNSDLVSRDVTANISGNGTIEVNALDRLGITVAGTATIRYSGNPSITKDIMGAATITQS